MKKKNLDNRIGVHNTQKMHLHSSENKYCSQRMYTVYLSSTKNLVKHPARLGRFYHNSNNSDRIHNDHEAMHNTR